MKKSYLIIAAIASVALASCSSDDFVGDNTQPTTSPSIISFGSGFRAVTRAEYSGAEAADMLNKKFVVTGFKGNQSTYATTGDNPSVTVFDNYLVEWAENTANTTETNTRNWEYVGKGPWTLSGATSQTVKYWDNGYSQYDFIAYSLGNNTLATSAADYTSGKLNPRKINASAINPANLTTGAYTLEGSTTDLADCFIADLVTVKRANGTNGYSTNPVTIRFRNLSAKVRMAIYETVPGYTVQKVQFYAYDASLRNEAYNKDKRTAYATLYTDAGNNFFCDYGTYTVSYPTLDDAGNPDNGVAHVTFAGDFKTSGSFSAFPQGDIGTTSSTATYPNTDTDNRPYTIVPPNETGVNLNLCVDFELVSEDGSGEVIKVYGATAQVPADYAKWQSGTAYTYLFKISDKSNVYTDPDHNFEQGLYPITFDAMVVENVDNDGAVQETITTVTTPSITTYQQGEIVTAKDEYISGKKVFVTVEQNNALAALTTGDVTVAGNAALYLIPDGKSEAEIYAALKIQEKDRVPEGVAILGRNGIELKAATTEALTLTNKIPDAAGVEQEVYTPANNTDETKKAAYFTPTAPTGDAQVKTYAFVYTQTANTSEEEKFEVVSENIVAGTTSVKGYYCNYEYVDQANKDAIDGVGITYYTKSDGEVYAIPATAPVFFYGQSVSGLYVKNGNGEYVKLAYGTAQTGTTYYLAPVAATAEELAGLADANGLYLPNGATKYTPANGAINPGTTYYKAPVAVTMLPFANFGTSLFKKEGTDIVAVTEATPGATTEYYTDAAGTNRVYILPQQANGYYLRIDHAADSYYACPAGETALAGKTYYDRYLINNGDYTIKVIKVVKP